MSQAVLDDIGDDMDAFVSRARILKWEAKQSLRALKLAARDTLAEHADVLARATMYHTDTVNSAIEEITAKQVTLTEARTHWAVRVLEEVEKTVTGEIRFDASPVLAVNEDRQKFLITHFQESFGFQTTDHLEWFPEGKFINGLNINTPGEMHSLVQQLRDRYAVHQQAMLADRAGRVGRKHGAHNVDYTRIHAKHARDPAVQNFKVVFDELTAALQHMSNERHSVFTSTAQSVKKPIRGLRSNYSRNPAEEDITFNPDNRYMFKFTNPNTGAVVKVQSTSLRRRMPYIPYTENKNTTEFINNWLLPHTLRWVLVTISTATRSFAIKIMPFHGRSTSMVFPFIAKVTGDHKDTEDMTDFRDFNYDVYPLEPYVLQGKPREVDVMYQAVKVSRLVGYTRAEVKYDKIPKHVLDALYGQEDEGVFPAARAYYSVEDEKRGDTSVYILFVGNQALGVQVYAPILDKRFWRQPAHVANYAAPGAWVSPPQPQVPQQGGGGGAQQQPLTNNMKPHVYSLEYLGEHQDIKKDTVPQNITMVGDDGESTTFSLTDVSLLTYRNEEFKMTIKPFMSEEFVGFNWGMYRDDVLAGYLVPPSPDLIDVNDVEQWQMKTLDRDGNVAYEVHAMQVLPSGTPTTRQYNVKYPIYNQKGSGNRGKYYKASDDPTGLNPAMEQYPLPLQPRRLAARPGPAPWGQSASVEMAGVLASLAEIKRALNEARALSLTAPAPRAAIANK